MEAHTEEHATKEISVKSIFKGETDMASNARTIGRTDTAQPETAAEERTGLPYSTREQEIRSRAYEIYLQRGGQPGNELDDWLRAELELTTN